jgi:hypothetical protein
MQTLRAIQIQYPSPGLRRLIAFADAQTANGVGPEEEVTDGTPVP